jgi:hypothetical protein
MAIDINIPIEDAVTDGSLNQVTSNAVFDALAALPSGTVTSVGLTMPSAFTVANSPITSSGDIAVTGAGVASQYVRGDGSLANFPTSSGGGASVSYYLNGSVSQGTFGGVAMKEMNKVPIIGAGTDFTISTNGYIQSFITDANDPNQLEIPAGNWNFETYFSASSSGGNPSFYIELYKWDGATLTLIASNSTNPEIITGGTATDLYLSALAVPQTTLALTDRLAIRIYVTTSGRTIKLHTENNHLSQIITTFSTGLTSLNGITAQVQNLATGTSGSDFAINSTGSTHTFNLPTASAANRGALSTADWTTFNSKQAALVSATNIKTVNGNSLLGSGDLVISGGGGAIEVGTTAVTSGTVGRVFFQGAGNVVQQSGSLFWDNTNSRLGVGATPATTVRLDVRAQGALSTDIAFRVRNSADNLNIFQVNGNNSIYMLGDGDAGSIRLMRQTGHSSVLQHRSVSTLPSIFTIGTTPSGGSIGQIVFDTQLGDGSFSTFTMQRFISGITDLTGSALQGSFGANNTTCFVMKNSLNYQSFGSIPTTTPIDHFAMYSADITAGNAAPHFRTENGNIIKLYQQSSAGILTVPQLVTVLQNLGLLS